MWTYNDLQWLQWLQWITTMTTMTTMDYNPTMTTMITTMTTMDNYNDYSCHCESHSKMFPRNKTLGATVLTWPFANSHFCLNLARKRVRNDAMTRLPKKRTAAKSFAQQYALSWIELPTSRIQAAFCVRFDTRGGAACFWLTLLRRRQLDKIQNANLKRQHNSRQLLI